MKNEAREYYNLIEGVCQEKEIPLINSYRKLRELLELLCHSQIESSSLQMTDLSARINYVATKIGLNIVEQNRLHTFRLTCNDVLNHRIAPQSELLMRDAKTLAFFVKRISGVEIPHTLYRLLPSADATFHALPPAQQQVKRMRVCFEYADEQYLYVQPTEHIANEWLRVRYNVEQVNEEFSETCELLWRHAQLNLLDVNIDAEGILTPGFIILEPDYLLDISSLAACFCPYGSHPLNYTFSRLQQSENSSALLLGNIANLFLDEWIHAEESEPDYLTCMRKAFKQYALELATCPELNSRETEKQFFEQCRLHFENIKQTVTETFNASGYALNKADAVLEPSYICEALGLQGRLDYMQRDMSSFIEMKSGKADEFSIRGRIEPKEDNRIQMLLYQAILEYSMGRDHRKVQAYLLYTRYPLLYPARSSWAMVRRAINIRNRIVAEEFGIQLRNSSHYTAERLATITPETLNERGLTSTLWKRFLYPQIDSWSKRLQTLSPLEKSYFHTMYNFITKELYTSKTGDIEYDGRTGASALWLATLEEKLDAGEILLNLRIAESHASDEQCPVIVFNMEKAITDVQTIPNFRQGEAILCYQRNHESDNVTNALVFKGNIEKIGANKIHIRLRNAQRNSAVLPPDSNYAIEHDTTMDTGFRSMYQGLTAFMHANPDRRALLLGQREAEFNTTLDEAIEKAADDDFRRITLKAQAARDYFLLIGPPGTGKTSKALRSMIETFHKEGKQLLLLSYTNRAVDEICKTLTAITPEVDFIRIGNELSCEEAYRPHLLENILATCSNRKQVQERLHQCPIIVGTVSTLSGKRDLFRLKCFDVAIIDEATQILEPQLLGLLCQRTPTGENAIGKFILIGDHKQLPAVVLQTTAQTEVTSEELRNIGLTNLKDSLFERLYRKECAKASRDGDRLLTNRIVDMLCRQGRMHPQVATFPNKAFYANRLTIVGLPHQCDTLTTTDTQEAHEGHLLLTHRTCFIPSQAESSANSDKQNHSEAQIVSKIATMLYQHYHKQGCFNPLQSIGIITPYRSQIALIRKALENTGIEALTQITVDTVERYQGSERDAIIYSCCVNRAQQFKFLSNLTEENGALIDRKLNVALTRARKQLFVTGVPEVLKTNAIYKALIEQYHQVTLTT